MNNVSNISIENARIIFRNFSGEESRFNKKGSRNFGVILTDELAEQLKADGWNVKYLKAREEGDPDTPWLSVSVAFGHIPPKIMLVTSSNMAPLDETTINQLDYAEIANVDLIVRPYCWEVNGNFGIKAYLKTMYVTIVEDEFADKYNRSMNTEEVPF